MPKYLNNKAQMITVLSAMNVPTDLPKKGHRIILHLPPGSDFRIGSLTCSAMRSTYGAKLYELALGNTFEEAGIPTLIKPT